MKNREFSVIAVAIFGDLVAMYASLFSVLFIRYETAYAEQFLNFHAIPFSIMFAGSVFIFYIAGLYTIHRLRNSLEFYKTLFLSLLTILIIAIAFFYLIPIFGIAPKTNLFLYFAIFLIFETLWRRAFNHAIAISQSKIRLVLFGGGETEEEIASSIKEMPQLGYELVRHYKNDSLFPENLEQEVRAVSPEIVIIPNRLKKNSEIARIFYALLLSGISIRDSIGFFENSFKQIPLSSLEEEWLLENIAAEERFYDGLKRSGEVIAATILFIVLIPVLFIVALLVALTSRGPVLIRQTRIGKNGKPFTLLKFRSMMALAPNGLAETQGAEWAKKSDARVTLVGKILRASHLDEFPQLLNIIQGDLSFVGPRPERPEFVESLKKEIPFYETRHLIQPGITGWAQLNYRYGASVEDARRKLEYDLYYLKNRSLVLDFAIIIKTLKLFFSENN